MKKLISAAMALLVSTQIAQSEVWVCDVQQNAANGGWIPETLVLGFGGDCDDVCVGVGFGGGVGQIDGYIAGETAQRTTVSFRIVHAQDSARQTANLDYRASLFRGRSQVTVSMTPRGYSNRFFASGTCARES